MSTELITAVLQTDTAKVIVTESDGGWTITARRLPWGFNASREFKAIIYRCRNELCDADLLDEPTECLGHRRAVLKTATLIEASYR